MLSGAIDLLREKDKDVKGELEGIDNSKEVWCGVIYGQYVSVQ